jgi:hypothetical protein
LAYVLDKAFFWTDLHNPVSFQAFRALQNPHDVRLFCIITAGILCALFLNFFFRRYVFRGRLSRFLERFSYWGPHLVRFSVAIALFLSAFSQDLFGPELTTAGAPFGALIRIVLFASGVLIALGLFTEVAGLLCIGAFVWGFFVYGAYMLTYLNYLGEFIILALFGMRVCSLDRVLFGPLRRFRFFEKYETLIGRVFYGSALVYTGITVKLLHPALTLTVVSSWNLTQFHWLFPSDPLLVTLGAGLAEIVIGLFILFGFELRFTVLVSLFYITLSLLFFRELVWPHLLLYGLSLNLLVQPETFTLDHLLFETHRRTKPWWLRPLSAHVTEGKSSHSETVSAQSTH